MGRFFQKKRCYKLLWGVLAVVLTAGTGRVTEVSAADKTAEEWAQKVEKTWQVAGSKKCTRKVKVTLKTSQKNMWKNTSAFTAAVNKAIYGNAYLSENWDSMETEFMDFRLHKMKKSTKQYKDYVTGVTVNMQYKGKKLTYTLTVNGKDKDTRYTYRDIEANKYCAAEIQNATKDMDQYDRAWYVNLWVQGHAHFENEYTPGWAVLKNKKAHGVCYDLAYFYEQAACYAGVEHFGRVSNSGHTWNVVKIDGKIYYVDVEHSRSAVKLYYASMAGLVDYLNNDAAGTEMALQERYVRQDYNKGPITAAKDGYAQELWQKVQTVKASMTAQEWKEKIEGYWKSEKNIFNIYQIKRETIFSEPWEAGFAHFGLQTLEQVTDYNCFYSFAEYDKPSKWLYAWIRE